MNFENRKSCISKIEIHCDFRFSKGNKTDNNKTDYNNVPQTERKIIIAYFPISLFPCNLSIEEERKEAAMKYFYGLQGWLCQTKISREVLKEHTTKAMEQMILEAGMGDGELEQDIVCTDLDRTVDGQLGKA